MGRKARARASQVDVACQHLQIETQNIQVFPDVVGIRRLVVGPLLVHQLDHPVQHHLLKVLWEVGLVMPIGRVPSPVEAEKAEAVRMEPLFIE